MPKLGIPTLGPKMFSGWMFVVVAGLFLALIAIIDSGGVTSSAPANITGGSTGCRLEVTTDQLNLRAAPNPNAELVGTLTRGTVVDGTPTVTNLYRQLTDGKWAVAEFLTPVPGSNCS